MPTANTPDPGEPEGKPPVPPARPVDVSRLKLYSIRDRQHLSEVDAFAGTPPPGCSFANWLAALPAFLAVRRLGAVVDAIVAARHARRPVVFAMGAHVVKVGCGPVVIDLMRRGLVTAVACNGATAIHDVEIAMLGATSEDVGENLRDGRFGMVRETAEFFADAARLAAQNGTGYGAALGTLVRESRLPHAHLSVLGTTAELAIPATVHVAIGTDTVHMPAVADGAAIGAASMVDFRLLCDVVTGMGAAGRPAHLDEPPGKAAEPDSPPPRAHRARGRTAAGGVWCNLGSAVLLPEVFLKAVAVARNLGADLDAMVTANFDQLRHYRPLQNVVGRPVTHGRGYDLAGPHELLLPLLRQALIERWAV